MKKVIDIVLILFCFGLIACEKNNVGPLIPESIWIKSTKGTDTMVFDGQSARFDLNRGKEMVGESLIPLPSSGPYDYKLIKDSISLRFLLASRYYLNFYFKMDSQKQQFQIGNFFVDSLSQNDILTFT